MRELRLQIELVPPPLWYVNLRTYLTTQRWIRLRNAVRRSADFTCEICGHKASEESGVGVHAHEDWQYQDEANPATATLARIGCICMLCHQTHHIKQTRNMVASGEAPQQLLDDVIAHFCRVNACDLAMFEHEERRATSLMASRMTIDYGIEWGRFGVLLGKRVEAGDYSTLHTKGKKQGWNDYGPIPWIGDVSLEIADGSQIVHVIPLFDGAALRGATKRAIIAELLPLERCLSSAAMNVASIWIGKTYAEFVSAATS